MQTSSMTDQIKQVADRITFASMSYRIWRIYTAPGDRTRYLGVLRDYNSFFLTSLRAHFVATVITLYGLYETRRESISLTRLVRDVSEPKLRSDLQSMLDKANTIWRKKITILRNDVYARLSDIDFEAKFAEANISPDEIEALIKLSKDLLNKLPYANDRSTLAFNLDPASDIYNLLDRLLKTEG
jgi:AbiU2